MQLSLLLLTGLIPLGAPPDAASASVDFAEPAECGTSDEFFETLERDHEIGRADLTFERVRLDRDGTSFRLDWVDAQGTRTFRDQDCRTLFRTAIVIAVSSVRERTTETLAAPPVIESAGGANLGPAVLAPVAATPPATAGPVEKVEPLAPETPTPLSASSRARPPTSKPQTERQRANRSRRLRGEAALAFGAAVALFPKPTVFVELGGALRLGEAGASLSFRFLPPAEANTQDSFGIRLEGWGGRFGVFYEPVDWLRADLGLGTTYLIGSATGVRDPEQDGVWLFAPELDLAGRFLALGPFALDIGLRGWVAANAPRFEVDGEGEIYRVPPAGAALFLRGRVSPR